MLVASRTRVFTRVIAVLTLAVSVGCHDDSPVAPTPATAPKLQLLATPIVTVTNTDDAGPGSLRQAIADAAAGSIIQFDAAIAGKTIVLSTGFLTIDKSLTIEGSVSSGITLSGGFNSRVFYVDRDIDVTLRNLSIVNGKTAIGGGIVSGGNLTLDHAFVGNNEASSHGGGIDSEGPLTILNSTMSGNVSGGIGGAIRSEAATTFRNVTIADNSSSGDGGGLYARFGLISIRNTIIANNLNVSGASDANCYIHPDATPSFSGTNIANGNCATDPAILDTNPMLGPLANNGGPTKTYAVLLGSPAIDAGTLCSEATDQRYVVRNQGASCDIGAFEFNDYGRFTITIGPNIAVSQKTGIAMVTGRSPARDLDLRISRSR
jgi:large repetitive protein